jgi:hypothetical protein
VFVLRFELGSDEHDSVEAKEKVLLDKAGRGGGDG